jgi:hypothetical protein
MTYTLTFEQFNALRESASILKALAELNAIKPCCVARALEASEAALKATDQVKPVYVPLDQNDSLHNHYETLRAFGGQHV